MRGRGDLGGRRFRGHRNLQGTGDLRGRDWGEEMGFGIHGDLGHAPSVSLGPH